MGTLADGSRLNPGTVWQRKPDYLDPLRFRFASSSWLASLSKFSLGWMLRQSWSCLHGWSNESNQKCFFFSPLLLPIFMCVFFCVCCMNDSDSRSSICWMLLGCCGSPGGRRTLKGILLATELFHIRDMPVAREKKHHGRKCVVLPQACLVCHLGD